VVGAATAYPHVEQAFPTGSLDLSSPRMRFSALNCSASRVRAPQQTSDHDPALRGSPEGAGDLVPVVAVEPLVRIVAPAGLKAAGRHARILRTAASGSVK
jgi:hypothetical protein